MMYSHDFTHQSEPAVKRLFDKVKPCGGTPLAECLQRVTEKVLSDYEKGRGKKTNCLVITDGVPSESHNLDNIKRCSMTCGEQITRNK